MLTRAQYIRLQSVEDKPWVGILTYFRTMRAEWDALEALDYVNKRLASTTSNDVEVWEYSITEAGHAALADLKEQHR